MRTITNLTARLERLEQQIGQTAASENYTLLFVKEGEDDGEAIERQMRQRGVTDKDKVIVVRFGAPSVRDE